MSRNVLSSVVLMIMVAGCSSESATPDHAVDRGPARDLRAAERASFDVPTRIDVHPIAADGLPKTEGTAVKLDGPAVTPDGPAVKPDGPRPDQAIPAADGAGLLDCNGLTACSDACSAACGDIFCRMNCPAQCKTSACPSAAAPFDAVYNCILGSCILDCAGGNSSGCATCVQTNCAAQLAACQAQKC